MLVQLIRAAGLIAAAGLSAGLLASAAPAFGPTVQVSAPQMFALADQARLRGDAAMAATIYRAMFADASPDIRLEARFRLARLESKRGNLAQAAVLLRQIGDARPNAVPARLE